MDKFSPIGVFDSGLGGISVLKELMKLMPNENYIYFGDSKNAPYGEKSKEKVKELSYKNCEYLLSHDVKAIVVACNTATSAAIKDLRNTYKDKIIIGLEPAIKPAVLSKPNSNILVLATELTLCEEKYVNLKNLYKDSANIIDCPAPNIVKFVEAGDLSSSEFKNYLNELLSPYFDLKIDSIVLGCTHFPFIKENIREVFPYNVNFFDGGYGASKETKRLLSLNNLLNPQAEIGQITIENSINDSKLIEDSKKLLYSEV